MNSRYDSLHVSQYDATTLDAAVKLCEVILGGDMLALVLQNEHGTFVHMRPGHERAVVRRFAEIDWKNAVHVVEEHEL